MVFLDFEGKNVEQALEKASKQLNLPTEDIKHDVMSYGSSGIFGLVGVKKAKIRVFLPNQRENLGKSYDNKTALKNYQTELAKAEAKSLVSDVWGEEKSKPHQTNNNNNNNHNHKKQVSSFPVYSDEILDYGKKVLETITQSITDRSNIVIRQEDGQAIYSIKGGDTSALIGKRGQTLEAIQYLLEKIVNKKNEKRIRVQVDVEGYLNSRKQTLQKTASKMARKVKRIGKPMTLGQMNAYDRRIVHLHLKEDNSVRTQSIGDGYYRKLMIFPKRRRRSR